jgi:hypothetical protein
VSGETVSTTGRASVGGADSGGSDRRSKVTVCGVRGSAAAASGGSGRARAGRVGPSQAESGPVCSGRVRSSGPGMPFVVRCSGAPRPRRRGPAAGGGTGWSARRGVGSIERSAAGAGGMRSWSDGVGATADSVGSTRSAGAAGGSSATRRWITGSESRGDGSSASRALVNDRATTGLTHSCGTPTGCGGVAGARSGRGPGATAPATTGSERGPSAWACSRGSARRGAAWRCNTARADPGSHDRGPPGGGSSGAALGCSGAVSASPCPSPDSAPAETRWPRGPRQEGSFHAVRSAANRSGSVINSGERTVRCNGGMLGQSGRRTGPAGIGETDVPRRRRNISHSVTTHRPAFSRVLMRPICSTN